MIPSKNALLALVTAVAYSACPVAVSAITITANNVTVELFGSAGFATSSHTGITTPASQLLDVTRGTNFSRTQIDYTGSGNQMSLLHTMSHDRSGGSNHRARTFDAHLTFTADAAVSYSLTGSYNVFDMAPGSSGQVTFTSRLQNLTTNSSVVFTQQVSANTANESFVFGGLGGDQSNSFSGSLSGLLVTGHNYRWDFTASISAFPDADAGATATGFVRLDIGGGAPAPAVPDGGSTLALLGLAVTGLVSVRRKQVCP